VCEGQQLDMNFETLQDVSIQDYIQMIAFKTAVLLAFSMYMGAKIGGAPQNDAYKLYNCALNLGISFQIKDDWLDLYGEASLVGKQIGGDILANKKTFLLLTALDKANPTQKASLQRLMQDKCINPDDKIAATTAIFQELNISEITQQEIKKYFNMAIESLDTINAEKGKIAYLKNYFIELFNRQK
jgi:geranylgeranyl diphosphate synthase type II